MKSLIYFSFLAIIFFSACKSPANDHESDHKKDNTNNTAILRCTLDTTTAKQLVSYFDERSFKRPGKYGYNDTRCVWFSKEQLMEIIENITEEDGDGVRFYLAAYHKDSMPSREYNERYRDHTTLIMVSTFDTLVKNTDPIDPKPDSVHKHWDYFGKRRPGRVGVILTTDPENRGEMCPPPNICANDGALLF